MTVLIHAKVRKLHDGWNRGMRSVDVEVSLIAHCYRSEVEIGPGSG